MRWAFCLHNRVTGSLDPTGRHREPIIVVGVQRREGMLASCARASAFCHAVLEGQSWIASLSQSPQSPGWCRRVPEGGTTLAVQKGQDSWLEMILRLVEVF